jgi:excisionase family DNA binding protein
VQQAARLLGAHVETIRRLARRGAIPSFKVGKDWRFNRSALDAWSGARGSQVDPATVLIIDDEAGFCRALAGMVAELGLRTLEATDARVGLELARSREPDLILLDLKMPNMNGPQFLAELRKTHADLPVVVVTGYPDGVLMQEASRFAPLLLLAKPIDRALLQRTVRAVLGGAGSSPVAQEAAARVT